ncbi:MAG TPA: hypothetical protein VM791_16770 [Vicinamibacterales bacterium]|nr:hypothetical protein [Vicinamibacterales bacterium]
MTRLLSAVSTALLVVFSASVVAAPQTAEGQGQTGQRGNASRTVIETISGFSVVLVLGETQSSGAAETETLPGGAKKALNDMREFLPYKNYRVLDSQWTSCCSPRSTTTVAGRLQGVVGNIGPNSAITLSPRGYTFSIAASVSGMNIPVRFVLAQEDTSRRASENTDRSRDLERERQNLQAEIESLRAQVNETQKRVEVGMISAAELRPLQDRHAAYQRRLTDLTADIESAAHGGARPIIDSSFTMDAGETVVVGTSKLGGDKALIAVVTAVKKGGGPSRE